MELNLTQQFLTENDCYRAGRTITPKGVMVHSTGVAQPDPEVFIRRWNKPGVEKCVHAFVAEDRVIQTLPWIIRGWHAGTGKRGSANNTHISFECCEPAGHTYRGGEMVDYDVAANQGYFDRLYHNAVLLTALLCRQYALNPLQPGVVLCHAEGYDLGIASQHGDVLHWWPRHGVTMGRFRRDVAEAMLTEGSQEEDEMTQEQFNAMMDVYLAQRAERAPSDWSKPAREWAESVGLVAGDGAGNRRYQSFTTREEAVQMFYRYSQLPPQDTSAPVAEEA